MFGGITGAGRLRGMGILGRGRLFGLLVVGFRVFMGE